VATMLALVDQVFNELGLTAPTYVAGNTTKDVVQVLALLNATGYELFRQHQWQRITKEYRFTTQYLSTTGTWTTSAATVTGHSHDRSLSRFYMDGGERYGHSK
jgi:nitric oxide reductase large subunit